MTGEGARTIQPLRRIGHYELYAAIASGGMARVHFGRLLGPSGFSRTVAVKRLHPQLTQAEELVTMLLDEAKLVSRIQHPNVVPTLDMVADDGELFVIMEYVHGESLSRLLRVTGEAGARIPVPIVTSILCGVLHGLHAAHTARSELDEPLEIVHRDVSPHNVLVGVDGLSRVLDFGVAKARGRLQSTRAGQVKGKLAYLAPEQVLCEDVSPRTDVYAASLVLWEALTGRRAFEGANEGAVIHRVLDGTVPPPSTLVGELPAELDAIVMRGLARDPAERFGSALELAVALEERVGTAPVHRVAEWIQNTAADSIKKRATELAAVERASSQARAQAADAPGSGARAADASRGEPGWIPGDASAPTAAEAISAPSDGEGRPAPTDTHLSQLSVVTSQAEPPARERRRGRLPVLVAASGLALAAIAVGWGTVRSRPEAAPEVQRLAESAAPQVAPSASPTGAEPEVSAASAASAPAPADTSPRGHAVRGPAHATPARTTAPVAPPAASDTCVPPYVVDADGVRRWKRQCR